MMKKLLLVASVLMVLGLSNAYAIPVTINVDELYDWGRTYSYSGGIGGIYTPTNVNPAPFGTNPVAGYTITADTTGNADLAEDTWGIGSIASIKTIPANEIVWNRDGSNELTFMFYGFNDNYLSTPDLLGDTHLTATGGHISVYLDNTPGFDGTLGTGGRTGVTSYTEATDGILVLDLAPVAIDGFGDTLSETFDFLTNSGSGAMFLSTTGLGIWDSLYNTNTQLYGSDFSFSFTARDNTNPVVGNWVVRGDAGGESNVIPEPSTMLLFSMVMLSLAPRVIRRKKVA